MEVCPAHCLLMLPCEDHTLSKPCPHQCFNKSQLGSSINCLQTSLLFSSCIHSATFVHLQQQRLWLNRVQCSGCRMTTKHFLQECVPVVDWPNVFVKKRTAVVCLVNLPRQADLFRVCLDLFHMCMLKMGRQDSESFQTNTLITRIFQLSS